MNRGRRRRNFHRTASPIRRTIQELDQQKVDTDSTTIAEVQLFPAIEETKFPKAIRPKGNETSPQSEAYAVQLFRSMRKALLTSPLYANDISRKVSKRQIYTYSDLILNNTENAKPRLFEESTWLKTKVLPNFLLPSQRNNNATREGSKRRRTLSSTNILENLPQEVEIKESQSQTENNTKEDFFSDEEKESELEDEDEDDDYAQGEMFDDDDEYETAEQSDSEPVL